MSIPVAIEELARTPADFGARPASHADGPPAPDGCGHDGKPVG